MVSLMRHNEMLSISAAINVIIQNEEKFITFS